MMIVHGITGMSKSLLTFDGYIPMNIRLSEIKNAIPLYWRAGDDKENLLEAAVSPQDGTLLEINLVNVNRGSVKKINGNVSLPQEKKDNGLPLIDLTPWGEVNDNLFKQRFVEEFNLSFLVKVYNGAILLIFDKAESALGWIKCGELIYFGLDKNNCMASILVIGLSKENISNFYDSIC